MEPAAAEEITVRAHVRIASVTLVLSWICSCAGAPPEEPLDLPFHVGMMPVEVALVGELTPDAESGERETFEITIPALRLQEAIRQALEANCFTQVTLLPVKEQGDWKSWQSFKPPSEDPADWDEYTEEAYWVAAAESSKADILLDCQVQYTGQVDHETTGAFSYNLLLFLLGGPFCYWVDDHEYRSPVDVSAIFYDTSAASSALRSAADSRYESEINVCAVEFESEDYDFVDRNGDDLGMYALSLVCPSGFLREDTDPVRKQLVDDIIADISQKLAEQVRQERDVILDARRQVNFTCDLDGTADRGPFVVKRAIDGTIQIRGDFVVRTDQRVEGLEIYEILADGELVASGEFEESTEEPSRSEREHKLRYRIARTIDPRSLEEPARGKLDSASCLQIRVTESGMSDDWRTYTFPIESGATTAKP